MSDPSTRPPGADDPGTDLLFADPGVASGTVTFHGPAAPPLAHAPVPPAGGRYTLTAEIGRGAMGAVWAGTDEAFGREVAVKVLLPEHVGKPELLRRFAAEARITARLQHPAIVPVFEVGELPDGRPFYAMRRVNGSTLSALLDARPTLCHERTFLLRVFEKVCEGIAYAHRAGVVHRDLKPSNVMVGEFGRVTVMDWGVAKVLADGRAGPGRPEDGAVEPCGPADGTRAGLVLGTPAYMAPEQATGRCDLVTERADVFGLGGILCVILTGKPPYVGADGRSVHRRAVAADLGDAAARLDGCGAEPELVALARRCLAADPADRPADAGAVYAALAEYLDSDFRRAERDLVRFFELSLDLFCIADTHGFFRRVNGNFTRVLGHPTAELLARPFLDFVHPADRDRTRAELAGLAAGRDSVRFTNRYRDAAGGYRWFEWTGKLVPGEGVVFAVARDVTDRVRLEDRQYVGGGG
jgi:serine/threonine-protein kinase